MIGVIILFYLLSIILALRKPTWFVVFYLLASTKFLGFFDIEFFFTIGGRGIGFPMLNLTTFISAFFVKDWFIVPTRYLYVITSLFFFLAFGIIYPAFFQFESLQQALIASKEFWYISIFIFLVLRRKRIKSEIIIRCIQLIGVYFSFSLIIYLFFKISAPFYVELEHSRVFYPTYISLASFFYYIAYLNRKITFNRFIITVILLITGIILAGYFSLLVGTTLSLIIFYIFYSEQKINFRKSFLRSFTLIITIILLLLSFSEYRERTIVTFEKIVNGTDVALTSRDLYNEFRWEAINQEPLFGYGFIHKDAPITLQLKTIENNRFAESFGVIDSGYIDLLIKFGFIGMILYLIIWLMIIAHVLIKSSRHSFIAIGMALYLLQYFSVNYTWSVFSFAHGIIPGMIALFLIFSSTFETNKR